MIFLNEEVIEPIGYVRNLTALSNWISFRISN
jgi:hypothetical protein